MSCLATPPARLETIATQESNWIPVTSATILNSARAIHPAETGASNGERDPVTLGDPENLRHILRNGKGGDFFQIVFETSRSHEDENLAWRGACIPKGMDGSTQ